MAENAPPKPRLAIFFGIFLRKFWHLAKLNILFLFVYLGFMLNKIHLLIVLPLILTSLVLLVKMIIPHPAIILTC